MIVVDASIAVKILSREPGADEALRRISPEDVRCAPDWIRLEVANAFARKVREGVIRRADAFAAAAAVTVLVEEQADGFDLMEDAFGLSIELKHAMYDCLYLALAEREGCQLITADRKFADSAMQSNHGARVELIG